jgi:hypothetical protein
MNVNVSYAIIAVLGGCVAVTAFVGDPATLKDVTLAVVNGLIGALGGHYIGKQSQSDVRATTEKEESDQ